MQWFTIAWKVWETADSTNTITTLPGVGAADNKTIDEVRSG